MKYYLVLLTLIMAFPGCRKEQEIRDYSSETLKTERISPHVYQHTSFLQTESFGNVPCNGMVVIDGNEAVIFDTPTNNEVSEELISWVENELKCKIKAVVSTHFHDDCLGGLEAFHKHQIPSFAYRQTIELADSAKVTVPRNGFEGKLEIAVGSDKVYAEYLGEGHTRDNSIGYYPSEKILFGGCLIKELKAGKGYLGDSNEAAWSATVQAVKDQYPDAKIIIPGHGKYGGQELLDYTMALFGEDK